MPPTGVANAVTRFEHQIGAGPPGRLSARRGRVDHDDRSRAEQPRGDDRGEPDRPGADHRHRVAGRDPALQHTHLVRGGQDVGEQQRPRVVDTVGQAVTGAARGQDPGTCRVFVDNEAVAVRRVPRPKDPWGAWGIFAGASLAYLTVRRVGGVDEMPMLEVGACGFGPDGAHLAALLIDRVTAWQDAAGDEAEVTIEARRKNAATADSDDVLVVVDKLDHTFVVNAAQRTVAASA